MGGGINYIIARAQYDNNCIKIIYVALFIIGILLRIYLPSLRGRAGENSVKKAILELSQDNKVLQNLYIPTRNGSTEIDVVWVSRKGTFVFESKNYSGWIFGSEDSEKWMQIIYNERRQFYNPKKQK